MMKFLFVRADRRKESPASIQFLVPEARQMRASDRISLAQVRKWIVDLGEVPAATLKGVPAEFTASELERWSTISETPSGRLRHLKPAVQLSETPPYWARPSVPLGYHRPVWP
jgi:hypothetical protein